MKKTKNNHNQKYDKTNSQNRKQFRNRCLVSQNNEIEATNHEIIEKIDTHIEKTPKLIQVKKFKENLEERSEEESENESDENNEGDEDEDEKNESEEEEEDIPMKKENFNIKLFMIVY